MTISNGKLLPAEVNRESIVRELEVRANRHVPFIGSRGFELDPLFQLTLVVLEEGAEVPQGIVVNYRGRARGGRNFLLYSPEHPGEFRIELTGVNNIIALGSDQRRKGRCQIVGDNCLIAYLGDSPQANNSSSTIYDNGGVLFVGKNVSSNGANFAVGGDTGIYIGEDCMLSWGIQIRSSDIHAVVDLEESRVLNYEQTVVLSPHVWVGPDVMVSKGVCVGAGSIIGGSSVVTKSVPRETLVVGTPAKIKREHVSWTRRSPYRFEPSDYDALRQQLLEFDSL